MLAVPLRRPGFSALLSVLVVLLGLPGCSEEEPPSGVRTTARGKADALRFRFVDVAAEMGYTMRNRTGKDGVKEFIVEAMPPGIAVEDFDGDGWMDLYCPNGNDIVGYDKATRKIRMLPPEQAPRNALYFNRGGKKFEDGARAAGVDDQTWSFGAVAGDIDNDGDPDIYVCNWGSNRLYLNRGDGTFDEVASATGAAGGPADWSTGACLFDYDRDGDLDIYVAQYADVRDILEREQITRIDEDGTLHGRNCEWKGLNVYCGPIGLKPENDFLFKNLLVETGKLSFRDVSEQAGIRFKIERISYTARSQGPFYGFQPIAWDIDGDGWQDVFVANDSTANLCWMNDGDGTFTDRAQVMGLAISMEDYTAQASMGVAVGDINGDGLQDLVVSEFSHDTFNLLLAERLPNGMVVYNEKAAATGLRRMSFAKLGWGTLLFDPDHDGDLDFYFACGHVYPEVDDFPDQQTTYRQSNLLVEMLDATRPSIRDISILAGPGLTDVYKCSRAAVAVDFDNDGDCDIATTELNDVPTLLRCDLDVSDGKAHWLRVRLRGNPAAKVPLDPAGATVTVAVGGRRISKVYCRGSSFQSSQDPRLHFGLGANTEADYVEVAWPNGRKTRVEKVSADQFLTIRCPGP